MGKNRNLGKVVFFVLAAVSLLPVISAPIALLLGIFFINIFQTKIVGLPQYTKNVLQYSVVGLGFSINLGMAFEAGSKGFLFSVFTIVLVFAAGLLLGKMLNIDRKITQLISAGTAICGGSAIAAVSPTINSTNSQNSLALGIVFVLNALALFIFPYLGMYLGLSQQQFGVWAAIAIHDTSSVVGAASKFGDEALHIATTVKLARALFIIPIVLLFSLVYKKETKVKFPLFIAFFILAILLNTYLPFLKNISPYIAEISKAGLKVALFLIGTGLSISNLKSIGPRPFLLGILLWVLISSVSLYAVLEFL
ncbi:putative sulfate exporter family transporter [Kaistella sp. PBT33-4]|uniref:YeiH family protein n=1 Tax=Kaistella sp. PBT33-4 TaxID=3032000 RepID=UPI0023D86976|nr:putative sulfate exporter family transporter [Kaistella sp. PBT33-4]MDF0718468.1 putative sulfate exporter family transporter [Kaistella sp. PBT33-4]